MKSACAIQEILQSECNFIVVMSEVRYGDFKAGSNIKFAHTHSIRIKLNSTLSETTVLTYFTSIEISIHYSLVFSNNFLLKSIGLFKLSVFFKI